jgi:hypothetical protein
MLENSGARRSKRGFSQAQSRNFMAKDFTSISSMTKLIIVKNNSTEKNDWLVMSLHQVSKSSKRISIKFVTGS